MSCGVCLGRYFAVWYAKSVVMALQFRDFRFYIGRASKIGQCISFLMGCTSTKTSFFSFFFCLLPQTCFSDISSSGFIPKWVP